MNRYRYEELSVGIEESFSTTITEDMMVAFHELSGDPNPLHTDEEFSRAHGFPSCVVYGLLTASFLSRLGGVSSRRALSNPQHRNEVSAPGVCRGYA